MILAAGRGERMRPLTDTVPKPLIEVGGKPLIVWHLERLAAAGFKEVVINHAHLGKKIEEALGNGERWGLSIEYSAEAEALETAGGVANALDLLGKNAPAGAPFLVLNADTFTAIDFATITLPANTLAHLILVDNPAQHPLGDFAIADGKLKNLGERMLTFSGVGVYHPDLFKQVIKGQPAKLEPLLRNAICSNQATAQHYHGVWHDIGTPERLQKLNRKLLKHV